jgi:hypothetical protein
MFKAFFMFELSRPEIALHKRMCNERRKDKLCKANTEGLFDVL